MTKFGRLDDVDFIFIRSDPIRFDRLFHQRSGRRELGTYSEMDIRISGDEIDEAKFAAAERILTIYTPIPFFLSSFFLHFPAQLITDK